MAERWSWLTVIIDCGLVGLGVRDMDADGNAPDSIRHNDSVYFLGLFTGRQGIGLRRTHSVQFFTLRQAQTSHSSNQSPPSANRTLTDSGPFEPDASFLFMLRS